MLKADNISINNNEENSISSVNNNSEEKISESQNENNNVIDNENSLEKEKLKEDNERLKVDIEVLSKKLHDAVNRIGNLEKALENKSNDSAKSNPGLTYSTTTTTTTTTTSSIQTGGKTFTSTENPVVTNDASIIIKMKDLENTVDVLNRRLLEEVERRSELETSHSALVQETEDLTVKLFEEAQSMVACERKENFEKEKQIKKLKSIIDEKDQIIQALMEENKTLKVYIQNSANKLNDADSDVSTILNNSSENNSENVEEQNEDDNKKKITVRTRKLSNVNEILSASPFSPLNSILNVESPSKDSSYQTYAYQTFNRELYFDNKNPFYTELYNFIKYKQYDIIEHSKFTKKCVSEEVEPCLDFQPVNPNLITITTKLSHYNCVRRIVKACKENTLIIKNIYEYPDNSDSNNENKEDKEDKENKNKNNVSCALCLRSNLQLPLNICYMDEEDKELQTSDKNQSQNTYVCKYCKERLLSAYDYYGYIKFIRTNLRENKANEKPTEYCHNIFGDLLRIRERMYWAKSGLVGKDYGDRKSVV